MVFVRRLIEFIAVGFDFLDRNLNPVAWQDHAAKALMKECEPRHAQFWQDARRDHPSEVRDWEMQYARYVDMWQSRAVRDDHNRVVAVRPMTPSQQHYFDGLAPEVKTLIADSPFSDSFHYRSSPQMEATPR
jgi:hypothetical protein